MKTCLRCSRSLPICDFAFDGLAHHCDVCREAGLTEHDRRAARLAAKRAYRARNLERIRAYDREYHRRAA